MQPGVNGRISAKAMGRFEGLHEGFLDQVLGFGCVAAQQTGGTEQPIAARVNQLLKIKGLRSLEGGNALKPIYFLVCQSVELALKAYLRGKGKTEDEAVP